MEQDFITRLTEITEANIGNPLFGVEELAHVMGMSHSSIYRKLHALTGKSVNQFIREIRLERAMTLIQNEGLTASKASHQTGFSSPAYFNNCFHEYFGFPPGEIKKKGMNRMEPGRKKINPPVRKKRKRRSILAGASVLLLILLIHVFFAINSNSNKAETNRMIGMGKTIAVLTFRNLSNDTSNLAFCSAFKQELIDILTGIKDLTVRSGVSTNPDLSAGKTPQTIGKELDAEYLVDGTIVFSGNIFTIGFQLIETKTGRVIKAVNNMIRERSTTEVYSTQREIVRTIVNELKLQ